jgi:hypothetical protein
MGSTLTTVHHMRCTEWTQPVPSGSRVRPVSARGCRSIGWFGGAGKYAPEHAVNKVKGVQVVPIQELLDPQCPAGRGLGARTYPRVYNSRSSSRPAIRVDLRWLLRRLGNDYAGSIRLSAPSVGGPHNTSAEPCMGRWHSGRLHAARICEHIPTGACDVTFAKA